MQRLSGSTGISTVGFAILMSEGIGTPPEEFVNILLYNEFIKSFSW
jgi:hypothetical protein